jgi:hypothetical protein
MMAQPRGTENARRLVVGRTREATDNTADGPGSTGAREATMSKLVLIGTHGPDDPTKAVMPFVLANGAGRSRRGIETALVLLGDAVSLILPAYRESVLPLGYPPLKELLPPLVERRVPMYV